MRFVLDTNAVIYLQRGQLAEALPVADYSVSVITEMELLSFPDLGAQDRAWLERFLLAVQIIGIEPDIKHRAIELRRDYRLKLPDAVIVATALVGDSELLTNDRQLARVNGLRCGFLRLTTA